jgi:hypothetical protein
MDEEFDSTLLATSSNTPRYMFRLAGFLIGSAMRQSKMKDTKYDG